MLLTRYNENGTKLKVDRVGLASVEKAGFTFVENPVEVTEIVEKTVSETDDVEKPAPVKRTRKPKEPVVQKEAEKDIIL